MARSPITQPIIQHRIERGTWRWEKTTLDAASSSRQPPCRCRPSSVVVVDDAVDARPSQSPIGRLLWTVWKCDPLALKHGGNCSTICQCDRLHHRGLTFRESVPAAKDSRVTRTRIATASAGGEGLEGPIGRGRSVGRSIGVRLFQRRTRSRPVTDCLLTNGHYMAGKYLLSTTTSYTLSIYWETWHFGRESWSRRADHAHRYMNNRFRRKLTISKTKTIHNMFLRRSAIIYYYLWTRQQLGRRCFHSFVFNYDKQKMSIPYYLAYINLWPTVYI